MWNSLRSSPLEVHWTRIEAWAGAGVPDVNGAASFGEFWLENKVCESNTFQPLKLWRPAQIAWQTRRSLIFPNVWNLVSRPRSHSVEIYSCKTLVELVTKGSGQPELILSAPIKWELLYNHIEQWFIENAPEK
jgi:hypothetical protein